MDPLASDFMSTGPENAAAKAAAAGSLPGARSEMPDTAAAKTANQLTPEEQMALFEKELKETDWGHQPC